jgi:hypothetical protein
LERARLGAGIVGGVRGGKTMYFYAPFWQPNGATWGGTIAPTLSCLSATASPAPSPSPTTAP